MRLPHEQSHIHSNFDRRELWAHGGATSYTPPRDLFVVDQSLMREYHVALNSRSSTFNSGHFNPSETRGAFSL